MKSEIRNPKSEIISKLKIQRRGQAAMTVVLFLLFVLLSVLGAVSGFALKEARGAESNFRSKTAFFAAEAGVDDAVYRLKRGKIVAGSFSISVNGFSSTTTVSDILGGKEVKSTGEFLENFRSLRSTLLSGEGADFFYGAQVGDGGLVMDNNSGVNGNVFVNGDVEGNSGAVITGTVTVAGSNKIEKVNVQGDAFVDQCKDSDVDGVLHTNNNNGCFYGSLQTLGVPPNPIALPLISLKIQSWKDGAIAGGVTNGNVKLDGDDIATIGPQKIVGNLNVENNSILTLSGNLWVTGNVTIKNNAQVKLSSFFGGTSGVVVVDGTISLENNSISSGSGSPGSYLMYLSTNTGSSAITAKNEAEADIVYTSAGTIVVENNTNLKEVTGYSVHIKDNGVVTYESGLFNVNFSSGPSGGWTIAEWKEVIQ